MLFCFELVILFRNLCLRGQIDLQCMHGLHGLACVARWEPYDLHYLASVSLVESVLGRSSTSYNNGRYRMCMV